MPHNGVKDSTFRRSRIHFTFTLVGGERMKPIVCACTLKSTQLVMLSYSRHRIPSTYKHCWAHLQWYSGFDFHPIGAV
jgi:hypothetical protein